MYRNVGLFGCMNKINASMVKTLKVPKKKTRDDFVARNNVETALLTISQRARAIPPFISNLFHTLECQIHSNVAYYLLFHFVLGTTQVYSGILWSSYKYNLSVRCSQERYWSSKCLTQLKYHRYSVITHFFRISPQAK